MITIHEEAGLIPDPQPAGVAQGCATVIFTSQSAVPITDQEWRGLMKALYP